ncbi:Pantothenate kinase [Candidatus Profftia lariciata]|uniref:type I pantothenate kinase n=1 Tax=Candidatus Profftia lariciata TaxID=1987921 RepID=UPI001D014A68|nr:type I pantothenate kinase [Candidatus Profftia lariciata]UDG81303.1 Pantothenate kinase [Candidatus Profftia lariciata]
MKKDQSFTTPYLKFNRQQWHSLSRSLPLVLTKEQIIHLKNIDEELSLEEVTKIYLPLSFLLNCYFSSHLKRQILIQKFLGINKYHIPYIIGIAGSVSVGKSTTANILKILLSHSTVDQKVEVLTTDSFLYTNKVLQNRGLMKKKGFPQSYDTHGIVRFISAIKAGNSQVMAPQYSQLIYDIVPDSYTIFEKTDILILEGLNILQGSIDQLQNKCPIFVSDFIDFSIYVDAPEALLQKWYINRFLKLRKEEFNNPASYFHCYSQIPESKAIKIAINIWKEINGLNLKKHILPTRERANLIITKGKNHIIDEVYLRK